MAEVPDIVIGKIKLLIEELEKNDIHIEKAILFGSYSKGNFNEWSDIDLALISNDFSGDRWEDKELIRKYNVVTNWDIAPLPYIPEDFFSSAFAKSEILEKGIEIQR